MTRYCIAPLVLLAALTTLSGCRRGADDPLWFVQSEACLRHEQCGTDGLCVEGSCASRAEDGPIAFAATSGARALVPASECRWDDECGPWVCVAGACADPAVSGLSLPNRSELRYWDGSCLSHDDCGPWLCASGFCAQPGRIGPVASVPRRSDIGGTGEPCIADLDCADGQDCRYPGYCHEGIGDNAFFVSEVPWDPGVATYLDASCNFDMDCAGRMCVDGWCIAPEFAGLEPLRRNQLNYYDGSCTYDEDCGPWVCVDSWCRDPGRVGVDHGVPDDVSQAARARAEGVWTADPAELAEWVEADALAYGVGALATSELAGETDKWDGSQMGVLGALGSSAGYPSGLGGLMGSGVGLGGLGSSGGYGGSGGIGTLGTGWGATSCSSNSECAAGDACVYPGECRSGAASEPFTTANIEFSAQPGDACSIDDHCGPMFCRQSVCTPVEDVESSMPPRSDIYFHDGSCDSQDDCGSWQCVGLWCRPR